MSRPLASRLLVRRPTASGRVGSPVRRSVIPILAALPRAQLLARLQAELQQHLRTRAKAEFAALLAGVHPVCGEPVA